LKLRRTQYEIFWEILSYCRSLRSFTQVINRCDLNSKIGQEHVEFLLWKGYLIRVQSEDKAFLKTTEKATEFLVPFERMYLELFQNSPEFKL
jgi:predicted transcriptional regulator